MAASSSERYVTLRNGQCVSVPFLRRLWAIEERGVRFEVQDGRVLVSPPELLDDADLSFLRANKQLLRSVLAFGSIA